MKTRVFLIFLLFSLFSFSECFIIKPKETIFYKEFEDEILKDKIPICNNLNFINLKGDPIEDFSNIKRNIKEKDIVIAMGSQGVYYIKELKNIRKIGVLVPNPFEYSKEMECISLYPDIRKLSTVLKEKGYENLALFYSKNSKEMAFYISMAAREKSLNIEAFYIESPLEILNCFKKIKNYKAILFTIDPIFFDKEFLKYILEQAKKEEKEVFSFLKIYLDYGVDVSFFVKAEEYAKQIKEILENPKGKGIIEIKKFSIRKKKGAREVWKDEEIY